MQYGIDVDFLLLLFLFAATGFLSHPLPGPRVQVVMNCDPWCRLRCTQLAFTWSPSQLSWDLLVYMSTQKLVGQSFATTDALFSRRTAGLGCCTFM